jgi:hypothetical protein
MVQFQDPPPGPRPAHAPGLIEIKASGMFPFLRGGGGARTPRSCLRRSSIPAGAGSTT